MKHLFVTFFLLLSSPAFAELSLNDLGFKKDELALDPAANKLLQERTEKLKLHQNFAIATAVALTATALLGGTAKDNDTAHAIAGVAGSALYWTTAYFAWTAPRPDTVKDTGSTKIHRALTYVHVPLMALSPLLGYLNHENKEKGKKSSALVKNHGGVAKAAYYSFMAAGLAMYFDF